MDIRELVTTYVHELDVHQNWRRQGVGSALITEAMTLARSRGSTKFWLSTGGHNETAQALYESLGGSFSHPARRRAQSSVAAGWWEVEGEPSGVEAFAAGVLVAVPVGWAGWRPGWWCGFGPVADEAAITTVTAQPARDRRVTARLTSPRCKPS